ncbi:hypothetical protein [Nocardia sp. NPDC127526]|uniref:hypothetical protein n=1 Tax=Nocardia sp. NPDC127526 TaxID=3345393 RepID=UPI0036414B19
MTTLVYQGEEANLKVFADEVAEHPQLADACKVRVTEVVSTTGDELRYGAFAELTITIATGVATSAVYEILATLLKRARSRGKIEDKSDSPDDRNEQN